MEQARGDLVSLLINLSLKDWARPAIDETEGEETLADEIERHVEFDEDAAATNSRHNISVTALVYRPA